MSELSIANPVVMARPRMSLHTVLVTLAIAASLFIVAAIVIYGADYYWLSLAERPFSPKHLLLKPSGRVGISLGIFGLSLFFLIFLYPLRKRISWLARRGSAKHWLDFHVIAGCLAPVVIMFHASFKFQGIAGMAFWLMSAVAISGIFGRYVYAQIPRALNSVELSLKELESMQASLSLEIARTGIFRSEHLKPLLNIPSTQQVRQMPAWRAVAGMLILDLARPFHVARLRLRVLHGADRIRSLGGFLPSSNQQLESAIRSVRRGSSLSKRAAYLGKSQQVFHLWHVVHRPFSYSFAVLAVLHLVVVFSLGYI